MIEKLDFKVNIDQLLKETRTILNRYPVNDQNQICFQNTKPDLNDVYEGTGDTRLRQSPSYEKDEKDFIYFNTEFRDTLFYDISLKFPGRMRLAVLKSKRCYWMHSDPGVTRHHFAILTNDNCFMLYKDGYHTHIPADGHCYKVPVDCQHTALNAGINDRVHLTVSSPCI